MCVVSTQYGVSSVYRLIQSLYMPHSPDWWKTFPFKLIEPVSTLVGKEKDTGLQPSERARFRRRTDGPTVGRRFCCCIVGHRFAQIYDIGLYRAGGRLGRGRRRGTGLVVIILGFKLISKVASIFRALYLSTLHGFTQFNTSS